MRKIIQFLLLFIIFTGVFFFLRNQHYYSTAVLITDLGGLTYLYSTVAIIFALLAAFIILFGSERWNNLVDASKGEIGQLNELWFWSQHLNKKLTKGFSSDIEHYIEILVNEAWHEPQKNSNTEEVLQSLHNTIYLVLKEEPAMMPTAFSAFSELMKYREKRIHASSFHLPRMLKNTLLFNSILLIVFSLFIGVHNPALDYIFTAGIFILVYVIFSLVDDLDNPTAPGSFYMTTNDYQDLLQRIHESEA